MESVMTAMTETAVKGKTEQPDGGPGGRGPPRPCRDAEPLPGGLFGPDDSEPAVPKPPGNGPPSPSVVDVPGRGSPCGRGPGYESAYRGPTRSAGRGPGTEYYGESVDLTNRPRRSAVATHVGWRR